MEDVAVQVARCHPAPHPPRHRRPPRGGADWRRSGSPRSGGGCRRVPVPVLDGVAVARGGILKVAAAAVVVGFGDPEASPPPPDRRGLVPPSARHRAAHLPTM